MKLKIYTLLIAFCAAWSLHSCDNDAVRARSGNHFLFLASMMDMRHPHGSQRMATGI